MDKFLFVLGSNWQLSFAELDNLLKYSDYKGRIKDYSANIAIVEFDELLKDNHYIDRLMEIQFILGGTQKIAKIFDFIDLKTIYYAFPTKIEDSELLETSRKKIIAVLKNFIDNIFGKTKEKNIFYAISIYPNLFDEEYYKNILVKHFLPFLNKEIMVILKQKKKKSSHYEYPEKNIKAGNLNPIFPHHLIKYDLFEDNRAEFIFGFTEEGVYIARTYTSDDPNFKKNIDEQRPFKEFKSAISPKLALILLNFLNLYQNREQKRILDPFVGNGTIILFAFLQDFQFYGSDIESQKVKSTIRNIKWLAKDLQEPIPQLLNERIKVIDIKALSQYFETNFFDGICTEPSLGPFYKTKPYYIEALDIIQKDLEPLYDVIFKESFNILKNHGRICIIAPIISTLDGGDIQLNVRKLAEKYNFKLIPMIDTERFAKKSNAKLQLKQSFNLIDAKKNQLTKRKIYVFEKIKAKTK
jgi:tRNA G10  N-methylase Trm11